MSRVYFHSLSGTAELHGSERAHLGALCNDIAIGLLGLDHFQAQERMQPLINPAHHINHVPHGTDGWRRTMETAFRVDWSGTRLLMWKGAPIDTFELILNTALLVGNDQLKLAARLHGQCEIHAWVDGPNRAWLADIMQAGLCSGIFRSRLRPDSSHTQGWGQVIDLLRSRDDEPVVTSYSVCDQFPNRHTADWQPSFDIDWATRSNPSHAEWAAMSTGARQDWLDDQAAELWFGLPDAERWELAMTGLRGGWDRELRPGRWAGREYLFGHRLSVLDLNAPDRDARLDAVGCHPDG